MKLLAALVLSSVLVVETASAQDLDVSYEVGPEVVKLAEEVTLADLARRVDQFAPVELDFDESLLDVDQKIVVESLVKASQILDEIFRRQVWAYNTAYQRQLASAQGDGMEAAREYYDIMAGPWDRLAHNEPFLDVGSKPPGAGYYPTDLTKEELEAWIAAHPDQETSFTSYFTVIERDDDRLVAVPYSQAYASELARAAEALSRAAAHASNPTLKDFLEKRAKAFLSNEYAPSDEAWMLLADNLIEPTIGPYEVYEDELMGWKAAFESFVTLKDPDASSQLDVLVRHLRDLEAALPIDDVHKNLERSFASPLSVVDEIYAAGDTRAGVQTLAYNLPNDPQITEKHGTKKVMLRNVINAKFEKILVPIAGRLMNESLIDDVQEVPFYTNTVMHELAHGLGPRIVHGTDTTVSVALQTNYSAIEEAKADVIGVHSLAVLADLGVYTADFKRQVYITGVASLFRCVRFGTNEAHGKGCAVQLNALLDSGAIAIGDDGRFSVDLETIGEAYAKIGRELLTIEATGDREAAELLLAEKGDLSPEVERALKRLEEVPVDIRPSYAVLDKMEMWRGATGTR